MDAKRYMLPWPPTVNTYWRHVGSRILISKAGRLYREKVAVLVALAGRPAPLTGPVRMRLECWPPDHRRRDLDNLMKSLIDSAEHAGVFDDDSQIVEIVAHKRPRDAARWPDGAVLMEVGPANTEP